MGGLATLIFWLMYSAGAASIVGQLKHAGFGGILKFRVVAPEFVAFSATPAALRGVVKPKTTFFGETIFNFNSSLKSSK